MHATIGDAMQTRVVTVSDSGKLIEALTQMKDHGFDQVPVVNDLGALVGVISYRWLAQDGHALNDPAARGTPVRDAMRQRIELPEGMLQWDSAVICCALLDYYRLHDFVLVLGTDDTVRGIASIWDALRTLCDCAGH